ncbi:MAG: DNA mismatch repair protein MutS, partial [Flavobacteriaceae bacterium]|nr:DNA mismatch repair protein MutS [Flavobacteriaceae bacterium]
MINIHKNTLQDLEFDSLLNQVSEYCKTELGKTHLLETKPFTSRVKTTIALNKVNEYLASFENDNSIPNHGFSDISKALKLLAIENTFLEIQTFRSILSISETSNQLIKFFKKFHEYYPTLYDLSQEVEYTEDIITTIQSKINRFGEIRDDASELLKKLRKSINRIRSKINSSFTSALNAYSNSDYLDDIRETVVENRRVLAVKAMYRRKVKGSILGSSKTGSIVYIEPEATLQHHRDLNNLEYEEQEEITRILKALTNTIRMYLPLLHQYQEYLTEIDTISAKASYARSINAVLPKLSKDKEMYLKDAYHPLLYVSNRERGVETFPQTLE